MFQGLDCDATRIRSRIGGPDSCKVRPNSKPWMVRLSDKYRANLTSGHICGGTLISEHHVLTARHCVPNIRPITSPRLPLKIEMKVVVGDHIISENDGEQLFDIEDIVYYSNITSTIYINIIKRITKLFVLFEFISLYVWLSV